MRILLYTRPCYLDTLLPLAYALCECIEVHLALEVASEGIETNPMELRLRGHKSGVLNMTTAVNDVFPEELLPIAYRLKGFYMVVHETKRAFDPRIILVWKKALGLIRTVRPDIVHFDDTSARSAGLFLFKSGAKVVVSIHDSKVHMGDPIGRTEIVRRVLTRMADGIICHSNYSLEMMRRREIPNLARKLMDVVPLGVLDIFKRWQDGQREEEDKTILFFGRMSNYKGIEILLNAMSYIVGMIPNVKLIIAGRPVAGYTPQHMEELERKGNLVYRIGHIGIAELCRLFEEACLVVVPYIEASQSGVIATAYAFNKPVVATRVGGLGESVVDNVSGRLVPPGDSKSLSRVIIELLNNPSERKRMSDNIRRSRENELAWPLLAEKTLDVYKKVLNSDR